MFSRESRPEQPSDRRTDGLTDVYGQTAAQIGAMVRWRSVRSVAGDAGHWDVFCCGAPVRCTGAPIHESRMCGRDSRPASPDESVGAFERCTNDFTKSQCQRCRGCRCDAALAAPMAPGGTRVTSKRGGAGRGEVTLGPLQSEADAVFFWLALDWRVWCLKYPAFRQPPTRQRVANDTCVSARLARFSNFPQPAA